MKTDVLATFNGPSAVAGALTRSETPAVEQPIVVAQAEKATAAPKARISDAEAARLSAQASQMQSEMLAGFKGPSAVEGALRPEKPTTEKPAAPAIVSQTENPVPVAQLDTTSNEHKSL
jgi:hypothetical protein